MKKNQFLRGILISCNQPVIGAVVFVKGTKNGAKTDEKGNYVLSNVPPKSTLRISFIGLKTKLVAVDGRNVINVVLKEATNELNEVVVVGYGTQKKANLTGAVTVIKPTEIVGKPVTSLANALQGTVPGVTVLSRPGDLGNDMGSINIRGRGNLGTSSPLYVVDGVPVSAGEFQRINPNDIASINVLKDAAASSIYGSRAAFGVFLVTTKKGREGKASISYNGYYGWQTPTILPDKVNAMEYATLINEANVNAKKAPLYDKTTAPIQEHNISISGGGATRYYVSGTFYDQASLVPDRNLNRYSFRANTQRDFFSKKFTLGTNISFIKDDWNRQGNFSVTDLNRMTPLTVAKHSDGTYGTVTGGQEDVTLAHNNPLRKMAELGRAERQTSRFNGSINAILKPIEGLSINGVVSYKKYDMQYSEFNNKVPKLIGFISKKELDGTEVSENELKNRWETAYTFMSQLFATYTKTFGVNDVSLMVGNQYEDYQYKYLFASRKGYISNDLETINIGSSKAENLGNEGDISERAFLSQFGRFNYAYDQKYLFEANVRLDQSSQFPSNHRLGVFPSFSSAWRISQEDFMSQVDWISNLKLRASWGKLGNVSNVGYYDYFDLLGSGTGAIINHTKQDGVWPGKISNDKLGWETVTMYNIGLDAGFFNNKWDFQIDYFDKLTSDILLALPEPYELGLTKDDRISTNAGKVRNKGIEFITHYRDNIGDFRYQFTGNLSKIWNEIVDLKGLDDQISGVFINRVGGSIGDFYGYKADGLFVDEQDVKNHAKQGKAAPGDIKYVDINKDGKIDAKDRTILGNDVPYFTYGLAFNASYKGFDLSIQGQGVGGVKVYLSGEESQAFFNGAGAKKYHLGRWTKANPDRDAVYPRILPTSANNHNLRKSSFWLYNADYFRIKNLILGYTLPQNLISELGVQNVRFYISATNLFTIRGDKRMKDFDPEMPSARGTYPNLKVFSLGANINF